MESGLALVDEPQGAGRSLEFSSALDGDLRHFRYRRHIRWMRWFFLPLLPLGALVGANVSLALGGVLVLEFVGLFALMSRLGSAVLEVDGEGVRLVRGRKVKSILFEDITKVEFSHFRYMGGWMRIRAEGRSIRALVTVEDVSLFAQLVLEGCERATPPGAAPRFRRAAAEAFLRTAVTADHSWARLEDHLGSYLGLPALGLAGLGVLTWALGIPLLVGMGAAMTFIAASATSMAAFELVALGRSRRLLLQSGAPTRIPRDLVKETRLITWHRRVVALTGGALATGLALLGLGFLG